MASAKRYFWLKLKDDFFSSKRIKKLRRMPGGDTYLIIYLKMQLKALKSDGILTYTGLESDFSEELALDLDEETDNVRETLRYLLSCGLAETSDNISYLLPYTIESTGSETASTQRSRVCRARKALQCNTDATPLQHNCNGEIEKEIEPESESEADKEKYRYRKQDQHINTESPKKRNGYPDDFEIFWKHYPKKVAKKEAYKAFRKVREPVQVLVNAIREQAQSETWTKENGRFIPNPATWLNQGRWDDVLPKPDPRAKDRDGLYTLSNGEKTSNIFLARLEEDRNEQKRSCDDALVLESGFS